MKKSRVMVFGAFDLLHPGHIYFLNEAKELGDHLIVSVARDKNIKSIKKIKPLFDEKERLLFIKNLGIADEVILGGTNDHLPHIKKAKPDIIALGYDQRAYTKTLKEDLKRIGLICKVVRLKPYKSHLYKSSKLKAKMLL